MSRACALGHQDRECLVIFVDHDDMNNCRLIYDIPTISHGCNKSQFTPLEQKPALLSRCDARARYHLGTEVDSTRPLSQNRNTQSSTTIYLVSSNLSLSNMKP